MSDAMQAILMAVTLSASAASAAAPVSGRFEGLDLAVRDRIVVGSFREADGPSSCAFTFRGTVGASGSGTITASDGNGPGKRGTITAAADKVTLAIPGARDFAGCAMVLMPEIDAGMGLTRTAPASWTALMRVVGAKVTLHPLPAAAGHGYLVAGNIVGIVGSRGGWLRVTYHNDAGRVSEGWIRASDVAPVLPAG